MLFSFPKHATSRCLTRIAKPVSFSTPPNRGTHSNSQDLFAGGLLPPNFRHIYDAGAEPGQQEGGLPEICETIGSSGGPGRSTLGKRLSLGRADTQVPSWTSPDGLHEDDASSRPKRHTWQPRTENAPASRDVSAEGLAIADKSSPNRPSHERSHAIEDAWTRLSKAMDQKDPQTLLLEVWEATRDPVIIRTIPTSTFNEILRLLDPHNRFLPFSREYKGQGPKHYRALEPWRQEVYAALQDRRTLYRDICQRWIRSGRQLGLGGYTQLLNLTRATWDGQTAQEVMQDMLSWNVQPDLICYNHYFEARCWSDSWNPHERQRLRVIPYNTEMRQRLSKKRVKNEVPIYGHKVGTGGLKWEITRLFTKMIECGIMADVKAFSSLITALAREGDIRGVNSILHKVWDVDVDALSRSEEESRKQTQLSSTSPVYPTQNLLFIIAHAFGSNNDIPAAIRVVDHFSRKFNIEISQVVWNELLEWAFVLSTRRSKLRKEDGAQAGQLPLQSISSLWNVMVSAPYYSEPTLPMYDLLIRAFWRRKMPDAMLEHMRRGVRIDDKLFKDYRDLRCQSQNTDHADPETPRADLWSSETTLERLKNNRWTSFVTCQRWFALVLSKQRWPNQQERTLAWERQSLPRVVEEFWRFRDRRRGVIYKMTTGRVQLQESQEVIKGSPG